MQDRRHRLRGGDDGFTVVELLLGASLSAILMAMVLLWLFSAQNASDKIAGDLEDESGLVLTLELALAELSDARPTALCLDPDPNSQASPETKKASCNEVGDNWGYWPTGSTRTFVSGSPFRSATKDELCFYALPRGTKADPAVLTDFDESADTSNPSYNRTPWGRCLIKPSPGTRLLARTLEPEDHQRTTDPPCQTNTITNTVTPCQDPSRPLEAAIPSSYNWTPTGTWTERVLGRIDTIEFEYRDFDGEDITPTGSNELAKGSLDDIAMVTITLTQGVAPDATQVSGALAIRANAFSPCRQEATTAPTCPRLQTTAAPTLTPGSAQIAAAWTMPSGNVPATAYDVQYKKSSDTDWTDFTGTVTVTNTGGSATIPSLTASTAYDVRVRATNTADESDWSASASATPT